MLLKKLILSIFIILSISATTSAASKGFWTCSGTNFIVGTDGDGDYIKINENGLDYKMYAKDVTPAIFAITASTIREFFINDQNCALHIDHTNYKINYINLAGK